MIIKAKNQLGISTIELMVSTVIGLFLLSGVVTTFLSTANSDVKREAISEMDANAAEALRVLRKAISHAGYRSIENINLEDDMAFYVDDSVVDKPVPNPLCRGDVERDKQEVEYENRTRDGSSKDFLTVIYLADNPCLTSDCSASPSDENPNARVFTDCIGGGNQRDAHSVACSTAPSLGMKDPMDAKIFNSFWLTKNISSDDDRTLHCGGNRGGNQPIVNDVETIQYLYGVKNDAGSITYRSANDITTDDQWRMVVSVQVGLLMRSSNQYVLDAPSTKLTYNILNYDANIDASDSRRLFRVYTTTINIENQNTGALL